MRFSDEFSVFGYIISQFIQVVSDSVKTLGVTESNGKILLVYNPDFVERTRSYLDVWLQHEALHVMLGHCTSRKNEDPKKNIAWNYAFDLAVNQFLKDYLPEPEAMERMLGTPFELIIPEVGRFKDYPLGLSAEEYYKMLMQDDSISEELETLDSHELWASFDSLPEQAKEQLMKEIMDVVRDDYNQFTDLFRQVIEKELPDALLGPQSLHKLLNAVQGCFRASEVKRRTRSRTDRRYGVFPGVARVNTFRAVVVLLDHSGSVDDSKLGHFYSLLRYLNKYYDVITVPFASEALFDLEEKFARMKFRKPSKRGNGGTSIGESIEQTKVKYRGDFVYIVVSDFENYGPPIKPEMFVDKRVFAVCLKQDENSMLAEKAIPREFQYVIT